MTLIVEDGTGTNPAAHSYVSLSEADAYFVATDRTDWAAFNDTVREAALRAGTRFLENSYRGRWVGYRVRELQALAWPRCDRTPNSTTRALSFLYDIDGFVILSNVVPTQVKNAAMEAAYLSAKGTTLTTTVDAPIKSTSVTVGAVSKSKQYAASQTQRDAKFRAIDAILVGLLDTVPGSGFGQMKVQRG